MIGKTKKKFERGPIWVKADDILMGIKRVSYKSAHIT